MRSRGRCERHLGDRSPAHVPSRRRSWPSSGSGPRPAVHAFGPFPPAISVSGPGRTWGWALVVGQAPRHQILGAFFAVALKEGGVASCPSQDLPRPSVLDFAPSAIPGRFARGEPCRSGFGSAVSDSANAELVGRFHQGLGIELPLGRPGRSNDSRNGGSSGRSPAAVEDPASRRRDCRRDTTPSCAPPGSSPSPFEDLHPTANVCRPHGRMLPHSFSCVPQYGQFWASW